MFSRLKSIIKHCEANGKKDQCKYIKKDIKKLWKKTHSLKKFEDMPFKHLKLCNRLALGAIGNLGETVATKANSRKMVLIRFKTLKMR